MSYWGGAWNSLKFSAGNSAGAFASGTSLRYRRGVDGNLIYKNNRAHKLILVQVAKRIAMQAIESEVHKLFPRYQKYLDEKLRDHVKAQQIANKDTLIKDGQLVMESYGSIETTEKHKIIARDKYGIKVPEALMLYYETDKDIIVEDVVASDDNPGAIPHGAVGYKTKTLCFIDLTPKVSMNSSKNLILTPVQGRDYTRKELVSGGDLMFTVSGEINSDRMDVYPSTSVKKFIQLAQYGGVISVNHMLFGQFNIKQVIIKDYSLPTPEFKNIQPYSFTCVAVEADEDVIVMKDTIAVLNQEIQSDKMDAWHKLILNKKQVELGKHKSSGAPSLSDVMLSELISNI